MSLIVSGGTLSLTGTNTYTGGTYVESGTLIATNSQAIEDGTNLYIGPAHWHLARSFREARAGKLPPGRSLRSRNQGRLCCWPLRARYCFFIAGGASNRDYGRTLRVRRRSPDSPAFAAGFPRLDLPCPPALQVPKTLAYFGVPV